MLPSVRANWRRQTGAVTWLPMCFPRHGLGSSQCKNPLSLAANLHSEATEHMSGYHMAVVAGVVFFVLRALFALMPAFSNRHPIKN
jgi:hypothetical protein